MKLLSVIAAAVMALTALSYQDVDWPQAAFDEGMREHARRTRPTEATSTLGQLDLALVISSIGSVDILDLALLVKDEGSIDKFKATPLRGMTILVK